MTPDPRRFARWLLLHGTVRLTSRRAVRKGDLHARMMVDPAIRSSPFAFYDEVRARGPLVRGAFAHLSATHEVCSQVLRSDDWRAGPDAEALPAPVRRALQWSRDERALGPIDPPSMLAVEPPDHTRYRRLVSKVFTARAVENLRTMTQEVADDLLDRLEGRPTVDLVEQYCALLPVAVISRILGIPDADHNRVLAFGHDGAPSLDVGLSWSEYRVVDTAIRGFQDWLGGHLERLRGAPGEDLLSQLVRLEDEGQRLDEIELKATAGLVLAAGFETTVNLLGSGTVLLLEHPEQLELLRRDPSLWSNAVDEVLRVEGPVQLTGRFAVRDTELAGRQVKQGSLAITYLGGANRDPAVFPDPHTFDVTRANAREHLTFSAGRHFCLGAALARQEGEIGLRSLFERYPDLELAGAGVRRKTRVLRGWERLPVRPGAAHRATVPV